MTDGGWTCGDNETVRQTDDVTDAAEAIRGRGEGGGDGCLSSQAEGGNR